MNGQSSATDAHTPELISATEATAELANTNRLRASRIEKLNCLREEGLEPFAYRFDKTTSNESLQQRYATLQAGEETQDSVSVAGRLMASRNSGMFLDLQDDTGKIQVFCHKEHLAESSQALLKRLDTGDIVGATGTVRRTPRGELSIKAHQLTLLTKTLLPLPEKYHGLTDTETRYRQRYLDLIMNEDSRQTLRNRAKIVSEVRRYMEQQGFLEVETPMLQTIAGGAAAKPFITHHNTLALDMYLRIAPELFLKRLVVGGLSEKLFEINRCFRNEGISTRHNPEFTSIEVYQAYADYHDMMTLTEGIVGHVAQTVLGTQTVEYQGQTLHLQGPWPRKPMLSLVMEATGVDFMTIDSAESARAAAETLGVAVNASANWGQVVEAVFAERVEATLVQPVHVIDFPREISPLSKVHRHHSRLVERFETYVNTWEIANAFSELTDPLDQRQRFEAQCQQRATGDDEAHAMDEDFLTALEYGLPPTGGMGMGIDRLVMLLTNAASIRDVIAFPTLRPR
ncbi:MAG: lysine--tRNA ligase [Candidatus Melainabacteria bacterium]|nr:lysine--tRNA ligase [Candidatus Melainabacteria bacterium]